MARAMFDYTIDVLQRVSFNYELFHKELQKAIERLLPHEIKELRIWLRKFTHDKPELYPCLRLIQ